MVHVVYNIFACNFAVEKHIHYKIRLWILVRHTYISRDILTNHYYYIFFLHLNKIFSFKEHDLIHHIYIRLSCFKYLEIGYAFQKYATWLTSLKTILKWLLWVLWQSHFKIYWTIYETRYFLKPCSKTIDKVSCLRMSRRVGIYFFIYIE